MLFRGFASKAAPKMATNVSWLSGTAWGLWRLACLSDGWCLTRRMDRTSVKVCLPASWQTAARLPSWAACELAAVPDGQASHIFISGVWAATQSFFFRGLADFAILSSKIALWLAFFQSCEPAWPASLWQPPDCLPAHWTGTLAKCRLLASQQNSVAARLGCCGSYLPDQQDGPRISWLLTGFLA